jgi:flagellar basal-body rod modification protein FlgD
MHMTTIEQTFSGVAARPVSAPQKPVIASDFETFLRMLTTQLKNQDPLNPMESSDFAVQLATFSSVEQQVMTNNLLTGMSTQMGMAQLAGWVGMEARAPISVNFDGFPITIQPKRMQTSDEARLVVRNNAGTVVQTLQIAVTGEPYTWSGRDGTGQSLPMGAYSFEIEGYANGAVTDRHIPESFDRIVEARIDSGRTILVMAGGAMIDAELVTALRN